MKKIINNHFNQIKNILKDTTYLVNRTEKIALFLKKKIKSKNKIFVCGNGGSFADASHFVGELTATYSKKKTFTICFIGLKSSGSNSMVE